MARKGALSEEALASLGAGRLAALLMELAEADPSVRKRLVLAAGESGGTTSLIKAIDRRLAALANSRGYIDWEKARGYAGELDGLRSAITRSLTPLEPLAASERLERLLRLAPGVLERVDDSSGRFGGLFEQAVLDLGAAWSQIQDRDPESLAKAVFDLAGSDKYGVCEGLIDASAPALGDAGMAALSHLAREELAECSRSAGGDAERRSRRLRTMLAELADAQGDVDAYVAAQTAADGRGANILGIATRLLDAKRADEALDWLDRQSNRPELRIMTYAELTTGADVADRGFGLQWERETLKIRALEMLDRRLDAQAIRWRLFEKTLEADVLRGYLAALPDFEDDEALSRANALAAAHPSAVAALDFFVRWPDPQLAAKLVEQRTAELDGRRYDILQPAAEALEERHPRAATILYRIMIDRVLERGASAAYGHAARNLGKCADLAGRVDWDGLGLEPHADYVAALQRRHGRKFGFWSLV